MDRAHVFFTVLLNLISVQLTYCGNGEPMMFFTPSQFEMRSMGAQPFIQAQFHPASGTIQQGIMLPQEHMMPQERVPEELYYQERMVPQGSMMHQKHLLAPEGMVPQHFVPQESTVHTENMASRETMVPHQHVQPWPQERMMPEERASAQGSIEQQDRMMPQENVQKIVHTSQPHPHSPPKQEPATNDLNETNNQQPDDELRAVKNGYEYSHPQTYAQSPSYGYSSPSPNYSAHAPAPSAPSYSAPAPSYSAPAVHSDPATKFLLKPDLTELIKPVTGKMAGKLNGLLGLLSLFGSGKGLELGGIKDLLIEGILKPLLVAKGGLKAIISKLAIPIIALILINVEVLITVWWLWEDCPVVKPEVEYTKPSYPATPGYNNYR